jgi:hypothetical protein
MDDYKGNALDWQAEPLSECPFRRFPTPFAAWSFQWSRYRESSILPV